MTHQASEPIARFVGVSLDCPDPAALADFYLGLLGGQVLWRSADSTGIRVPGVVLAMQRVARYRPPSWPCPYAGLPRRIAFAANRRWACNQGKSLIGGR